MDDNARSAGDATASKAALLEDAGDATEWRRERTAISALRDAVFAQRLPDADADAIADAALRRRRETPAGPRCWKTPCRRRLLLLPERALHEPRQGAYRRTCTLPEHHLRAVRPRVTARSNTLLVDCASMLVDSATYAGNLWAVCRSTNDPADAARGALVTSGLLYFGARRHHGLGAVRRGL